MSCWGNRHTFSQSAGTTGSGEPIHPSQPCLCGAIRFGHNDEVARLTDALASATATVERLREALKAANDVVSLVNYDSDEPDMADALARFRSLRQAALAADQQQTAGGGA